MSEFVASFREITGADESVAAFYLEMHANNLEEALQEFFNEQQQRITPQPPPQQQRAPAAMPAAPLPHACGLFAGTTPIPLKGLKIEAKVVGLVADVQQKFVFVNNEAHPIEATFKFGLAKASLYGVDVQTSDGRLIHGVLRERERALDVYDDTLAGGHGAVLVEHDTDPMLGEALRMLVGNLPPNGCCAVVVRYVIELHSQGETATLDFPNTLNLPLSVNIVPVQGLLFAETGISATVTVVETGQQATITSELPIAVRRIDERTQEVTYHADHSAAKFAMHINTANANQAVAVVERDESGDGVALMVSLVPHVETSEEIPSEIVFIVDRSGSMAGSRINQARNALQLFLRSLPSNCLFNIVSFGSTFEKLFPESTPYDEAAFAQATARVGTMAADLQGTNVLPCLESVLSVVPDADYPRQIFFLTDGEVENTEEVIAYIRKHAGSTRIFTLGIGADASPNLVNGIALAANGTAEFVASGTRIEPQVMSQLRRALQPIMRRIEVDWGVLPTHSVELVPASLPPIFDGSHLVFYGKLPAASLAVDATVGRITAFAGTGQKFEFSFKLCLRPENMLVGTTVHRLAARTKIGELEAKPAENKARIIELAKRYSLLTKWTSFVAVEERTSPTTDALEQRSIDSAAVARERDTGKPVVIPPDAIDIGGVVDILPKRAHYRATAPSTALFGMSAEALQQQQQQGFDGRMQMPLGQSYGVRASEFAGVEMDEEEVAGGFVHPTSHAHTPTGGTAARRQHAYVDMPVGERQERDYSAAPQPAMAMANAFGSAGATGAFAYAPTLSAVPSFALPASLPLSSIADSAVFFAPLPQQQHQLQPPQKPQLVATTQTRLVDRIVFLQGPFGCWNSLTDLAAVLGKDVGALRAGMPATVAEAVWTTLIALEALKLLCTDSSAEWQILAGKARRWLEHQRIAELAVIAAAATLTATNVLRS